jgi:hypothetical protein
MGRTSWIQFMDHQMLKLCWVFWVWLFHEGFRSCRWISTSTEILYESKSDFNSVKVGSRLNNSSDASQNDSFVFSAAQYKFTTTTDGKDVITVSLWNALDLNASYFKN